MQYTIITLIPIFSLILIGYFFKKIKFPQENFWQHSDKLTYYVLMPSLLVYKLSSAAFNLTNGINFILTVIFAILILTLILVIINIKLKIVNATFTSVVQGSIRFNTYVFLALISALFGDEGLVLAAILIAFIIPLINIICITIFALYVDEKKFSIKNLIKYIISNPLIIACIIGGGINFINLSVPSTIMEIMRVLSSAALPMGLLSIGVSLELKNLSYQKIELFLATFLKLIILPIIIYSIGILLKVDTLALSIILIFAAVPTAPSSFILARQLGGDVKLMSSIITLQTIFSMLTIAVVIQLVL